MSQLASGAHVGPPITRRRLLRAGAAGVLGTAASVLLGSCAGGPEQQELTVYNWGSAAEAAVYDAVFAEFERERSVQVSDNVVPVTYWGDFVSKLATQIAAGISPDLLNMSMEGTRRSLDLGLLTPLDDLVTTGPLANRLAAMPKPLVDAFTIDGAGHVRTFWFIALPQARSAVASLALIVFVLSWNDYFSPLIFLSSLESMTLPVGIQSLRPPFGQASSAVMAAVTVALLPVLIVFLFGQRWIVQGFVRSGLNE